MADEPETPETPSEEESAPNPIHEDFIQSAPEDLRDAASQLAPVWDKYVQAKFQEAADFRKQYENLDDISPEELQDYQAFKELQADPQKLLEWHNQWDAVLRAQHPELFADDAEYPYEPDETPRADPRYNQLEQQLQAQQDWIAGQEAERMQREASDYVAGELEKIKTDAPYLTDQDLDDICALANRYVPDNPNEAPPEDLLQRGFKDFQALVGRTERSLFDKKTDQPTPAQRGGRPDTSVKAVTDFDEAGQMARRLIIESQKG